MRANKGTGHGGLAGARVCEWEDGASSDCTGGHLRINEYPQ